jgi:hypothetical protein
MDYIIIFDGSKNTKKSKENYINFSFFRNFDGLCKLM